MRLSQRYDAVTIPLGRAVLCLGCSVISDSPYDTCPACGDQNLMNLGRILNPSPELGAINYIVSSGDC